MLSFTPFNYHKTDDQIIKNIRQYIKNPEHVFQESELLGTEPVLTIVMNSLTSRSMELSRQSSLKKELPGKAQRENWSQRKGSVLRLRKVLRSEVGPNTPQLSPVFSLVRSDWLKQPWLVARRLIASEGIADGISSQSVAKWSYLAQRTDIASSPLKSLLKTFVSQLQGIVYKCSSC